MLAHYQWSNYIDCYNPLYCLSLCDITYLSPYVQQALFIYLSYCCCPARNRNPNPHRKNMYPSKLLSWSSWYYGSHGASRLLSNAIEHMFLLLEGLQLLIPFVFGFIMLLYSMVPNPNGYTHSTLHGTLGAHASTILGTMQHVLALRHSWLLAKHKVTLCAMVPVVCPPWGVMVILDTSIGLWQNTRIVYGTIVLYD